MSLIVKEISEISNSKIAHTKKKMKHGDTFILVVPKSCEEKYCEKEFDKLENNLLIYRKGLAKGETTKVFLSKDLMKCLDSIRLNSRTLCDPKQKEIAGMFHLTKYTKEGFHLELGDRIRGESESVDLPAAQWTFHTHPETAYIRHKQRYGYPSVSDIEVFLGCSTTVVHCVAAVEGMYWISKIKCVVKIDDKKLEMIYETSKNPRDYVQRMNKLKICKIKFIPWNFKPVSFQIQRPG